MSVDVPVLSSSLYDIEVIFEKSTFLILAANPTAALAEKYCATTAAANPTKLKSTRTSPRERIYEMSPVSKPRSMICATTRGTKSSKEASRSLNAGARIASIRYARIYLNSFSIAVSIFFEKVKFVIIISLSS